MLRSLALLIAYFLASDCITEASEPVISDSTTTRNKLTLTDSAGQPHTPLFATGQSAVVLVFLMHDCPVTNATAPELARLAKEFTPQGVRFFGVYISEAAEEVNVHRREYALPFPGLLDSKLQLARMTGVTRAPEAAVLAPDGKLLYRGRIDDRAAKVGTIRAKASRRDLHLALEAVVKGRMPEPRITTAIGCYLPSE